MKKGTSFYLEEDIFDEIEKYRVDNGLKSKNTALERLIIEYKSLKKELEYTRVLVDYAKNIMSEGHIIVNNQENKNNIGNIIIPAPNEYFIKYSNIFTNIFFTLNSFILSPTLSI